MDNLNNNQINNINDDFIYSVSEITDIIKITLKENIANVYVVGEITNFKLSKSNAYFTLKDELSTISVVMWGYSNKKQKYALSNGQKIKVYGSLVVFNKSGSYNINAFKFETIGTGNLHQDYLNLKNKYNELGYFNESRKKPLPDNINTIGILTALEGAALQDFLYVLKKNNYVGKLFIKNCIVQGKDCPNSVVEGIQILDKMNLDVIIIARGGGSFEDLYGFSDKKIIEQIFKTKTCTISAIGHEIDFMLSDFVADIRAPTPSIAGEIVSNRKNIVDINDLDNLIKFIQSNIKNKISILDNNLYNIDSKLKNNTPQIVLDKINSEIDYVFLILEKAITNKINYIDNKINSLIDSVDKTNSIDPNNIINKKINPDSVAIYQNNICTVYDLNDNKIDNLKDFIKSTNSKKKLKLKFIDGLVLFDIRSIKIIQNEQTK